MATSASSWSTANSPAPSTACRRPTICAPTWCAAAPRKATELSPREREICETLGPALRERGLLFVGIDVIDGNLTEINVTSPTGIRAIARLGGPDVAAKIWDVIEKKRGIIQRYCCRPPIGLPCAIESRDREERPHG